MNIHHDLRLPLTVMILLFLGACGGGGGGGGEPPPASYLVHVSVSGLSGSGLVLQNTGGDDLPVAANGSHTFATAVIDGNPYLVTVLTQPTGPNQTCDVQNPGGTITGADVSNITVDCTTDSFTVGGNLTGLSSGSVTLQNNSGDDLTLVSNGGFAFSTPLLPGTDYTVSILTQPTTGVVCSLGAETGTVTTTNVDTVTVTCVDGTTPTATAAPVIRPITSSTSIVIVFSESMDSGTLSLGGTLAAEAGSVWSQGTSANDTLTLNPVGSWSSGQGQTLSIDVDDTGGNPLVTSSLTYDVYDGTLYFVDSGAADDSGSGLTPTTAKQTVTAAIAVAAAPAAVIVNAGTWNVNSDNSGGMADHVVLVEGVSLYGGYSADYTDQDPALYSSTIEDMSTLAGAVNNTAIEAGSGISNATVVDGFSIRGTSQGGAQLSRGILLLTNASPVIQNNTIYGGAASNTLYGIHINSSAASNPLIRLNDIDGGDGGSTAQGMRGITVSTQALATIHDNVINAGINANGTAYGIDNAGISTIYSNIVYGGSATSTTIGVRDTNAATLYNNLVYGGVGGNQSIGVRGTAGSTTIIRNNTIVGGSSARADGIMLDASLTIENNIILPDSPTGACIYDNSISGPAALNNNDLWNCGVALYFDSVDGTGCAGNDICLTTAVDVNALALAAGNISEDPALVDIDGTDNDMTTATDNDWHLSGGTTTNVRTGGLNGIDEGGWGYEDDRDDVPRPASGSGWAIGAYE